ncbi:hypothetical protein HMPREF0693_3790, partial [Proteus mirabilis ATCC 29906]
SFSSTIFCAVLPTCNCMAFAIRSILIFALLITYPDVLSLILRLSMLPLNADNLVGLFLVIAYFS